MPYIGRDLNRGNYLKLDDISSSFNSSTTTFNLTVGGSAFTPGSAFSILVSVGGVIQEPESAYQVNNSEITFANPPTAQDSFFCIALGVSLGIGVPGNGTVNGPQMAKPFNYDGYFYLDDANNRVGINSSSPTVALDVIGDINLNGNLLTGIGGTIGGTLFGNVYSTSGISTFYDLRVSNNLTVEGTTTTLDTNLIGVDRVDIGADSNTDTAIVGIQSGTADIVNLFDGTTEVLTVTDTGEVGINSISPNEKLDVVGNVDIKGGSNGLRITSTAPSVKFTDSDASGGYGMVGVNNNSGSLVLRSDDQNALASSYMGFEIDGVQRVGIASDGDVTVTGYDNAELKLKSGGANDDGYLTFINNAGITSGRIAYDHQYDKLTFNVGGTGTGTEKLRIQSNGFVGIGTDNPQRQLHILGTTRPLEIGSTNATNIVKLYNSATGRATYNGVDIMASSTDGAKINAYGGYISLGTTATNGVDAVERLRIEDNGNIKVPIGSDIEIGQTASSNHADGNAGSVLLGIQDGGGAMSGVKVTNVDAGTYNDQIITFLTAKGGVSTPTEALRIDRNGNLGMSCIPSSSGGVGTLYGTVDHFLAIGDSDTGIAQDGDGQFEIWVNNQEIVNFNTGNVVFTKSIGIGVTPAGSNFGNPHQPNVLAIGDADTGIAQMGDGVLGLFTNNEEALRITSTGTVGINCTPLAFPLEVRQQSADGGALRLRDASATYRYLDFDVTGAITQITARSNNSHGNIDIGTLDQYGRSTAIYIDGGSSPKVGIGTDAPTQLIDVYKTTNDAVIKARTTAAGAYFEADSAAAAAYYGLKLSSGGTGKWFLGSYNSPNFQIKDGTISGGTTRFTIVDSTGDIGIGTVTPASKLDVRNASGTNPLVSLHHSNADVEGEVARIGRVDLPTIRYHSIKAMHGGAATNNYITLNLHNGSTTTSQSEVLRLVGSGKVGINIAGSDNTSPVRNLDIADSSGAILRLISTDDSLGANERLGEIEFYTDDDDGGHIGAFVKAIADPSDSFGRRTALTFGTQSTEAGNAVERVRINAQGNIGIGTGLPDTLLHITHPNAGTDVIKIEGKPLAASSTEVSKMIFQITQSNGQSARLAEIVSHGESGWGGQLSLNVKASDGVPDNNTEEALRIRSSDAAATNMKMVVDAYLQMGGYNNTNESFANLAVLFSARDMAGSSMISGQSDTISGYARRRESGDGNGTFFFGPYGAFHCGDYTALVRMKISDNSSSTNIGYVDAIGSGIGLHGQNHAPNSGGISMQISPNDFTSSNKYQYFALDFSKSDNSQHIELRFLNFQSSVGVDIYLDHVLVLPRLNHGHEGTLHDY